MTVDELYRLGLAIVKKNQQGYLKPADFNIFINQGQRSYASWLLGSFQQYTPGRPVARVELGNNATVRQRLTPVIYGYVLSIDGQGKSPYPGDYLQTDAMSIYGFKRVKMVEQDRLYAYMNSVIDPVATNPIYLLKDDGFQFYPVTTGQANLSYVRNPPAILWAFTEDGNGRAIYDSVNSVDPVWDELACFEILTRALQMFGVSIQAREVVAFSQEIKANGQ